MHARASRFQGAPDRYDEGIRNLKEKAIPMAEQLPGFQGGYWLGNRETGQGRSVIFYSSAQALKENAAAAEQVRKNASESTGIKFQEVQELEVVLDTGQKVHRDANACRVVAFQADPAKIDEFVKRARDRIIPTLQTVDGFKGGVWLADRKTGTGLGLTLFGSLPELRASGDAAKRLIQETSEALGMKPLAVEEWEITAKAETPVGASTR